MRVALACPYAWDAPGGVQTHVRQLAVRLRDHGHDVLVVAPAFTPPAEPFVRAVGHPLRIPYNESVAPVAPTPGARRRVRAALHAFGPDVVHGHEPLVPGVGMFAIRATDRPAVGTFHAFAERSVLFSAAAPMLRSLWRRLDARIAVSNAAAAFVRKRFTEDGVRVIPNGVEVELFASAEPAPLPDGRRILFVNRLDRRKGFPVMVEAFRRLVAELPDALLVVAGDGRDRGAVRDLRPEVRRRVVMLGDVPHTDLPPYHAACEVFCAPATGRESFGIVLVEAMAAGLPVVATDIPGYRDVARDGLEAILVPPRDPGTLASALGRILGETDLAAALGAAGRERARRFSWDAVAEEVEGVYREVAPAG
ncbi:MAG TPA: glycosyltransferase family 4 protein [Actinomycetota bacterium]|nr:glycosyltransferase family 4 protein [Actinomycetota bacterium]